MDMHGHLPVSSRDGERKSSGVSSSSCKDTSPVMGAPTLMTSWHPNHLHKAPPANTIPLRVRASTYEMGGRGACTVYNRTYVFIGGIFKKHLLPVGVFAGLRSIWQNLSMFPPHPRNSECSKSVVPWTRGVHTARSWDGHVAARATCHGSPPQASTPTQIGEIVWMLN